MWSRQDSNEEFSAMTRRRSILQAGIGEKSVPEKRSGREINREVEGLPKNGAETDAQVGSDNDRCKQAESDGAMPVVKGLGGRMLEGK